MEQCSTHTEKKQDRIHSSSRGQSPVSSLQQVHLGLEQKDSVPSSQGTDIAMGLAKCHVTLMLQQREGIHIESETGKYKSS